MKLILFLLGLNIIRLDSFLVDKQKPVLFQRRSVCPKILATSSASTTTDGLKGKDRFTKEAEELLQAIESKEDGTFNLIIAQVAPSVRVAIPEEFEREPGSLPAGKLVASLKAIGFDLVLDTNTAADLTICEEGTELLRRLKKRMRDKEGEDDGSSSRFPLFTSCCPGWLNLVEKSAPELIPFISTCKSPHMMYGAMIKGFSDEMFNVPASKVYFCSVMPCVRKRGESDHIAFNHDGIREIDNVITTKDLGTILRSKGINPFELQSKLFDSPFDSDGLGSGAGQLFGGTGGVMEAAVRTVYEILTGESLPKLELDEVRGLDGVKETCIPIHTKDGKLLIDLNVAVANGLGNAKKLIKKIESGEAEYDFVEVMACPGGCIGGGGQPPKGDLDKRLECIYTLDQSLPRRKSHENPIVKKMYSDLLGEYGSEKAHEILHVEPIYGEEKPKPKSKQ
jgi:iron-only hydrogenase group A